MNAEPLKLGGVPEHFNLPWHLALASDELSDIAATWEDQAGGTGQMLAKLESGELDMVSILTEGTVAAIERGVAITMIQVYVATPLQWGVFVPAQSSFTEVSQLEDARIAISRFNSGSHLMAFIHAQQHGWKLSDEQFVVIGNLDGAVASFAAGESDLFLWEQHMTKPLVTSGAFRQLAMIETPWPSFVIAARDEVLTGRTAEVGRIVDAVTSAAVGLHDIPDVAHTISERYGLEDETTRSWLETTTFVPRSPMDTTIAPKVLAILSDAGLL